MFVLFNLIYTEDKFMKGSNTIKVQRRPTTLHYSQHFIYLPKHIVKHWALQKKQSLFYSFRFDDKLIISKTPIPVNYELERRNEIMSITKQGTIEVRKVIPTYISLERKY